MRKHGKQVRLPVYFVYLFTFLLSACAAQTPVPTRTAWPTETPNPTASATITPSPLPPTPTPSPTALPATTTPGPVICSPLAGVEISELTEMIVNPFAPPRLGSDDPHQGIDLADVDPVYQMALEGRPVHAVIGGTVAGVIVDRFPYGNAILVETPLEQIPAAWLETLQIPTPAPFRAQNPVLTCPESAFDPESISGPRSLYLLYAHFKEPPALQTGDLITCGMPIGIIGNSGNALNPHVHIEVRVGPSNVRFESMAHYTGSASLEEMANYCLWRVSEAFQLLDPQQLFAHGE